MNSQRRELQYPHSLYQELADTLIEPIDSTLPFGVRYHLSLDKINYLERLRQAAFLDLNRGGSYTQVDLVAIQEALSMAQASFRDLVFGAAQAAVETFANRRKRP